jgi:hypothetical protein
MIRTSIALVVATVGVLPFVGGVPRSENAREERDLHKILAQLRSADRRDRLYAEVALTENRKQMIEMLHRVVLDHLRSAEERDGEIVAAAILYLGTARAEEEVGLLVENLSYKVPRPSVQGLRARNPRERSLDHLRPCVPALVRIGTASIERVLRKVELTDDETVAGCGAYVLWDVLGNRLASSYVKTRKEKADAVPRAGLARLLEALKRYEDYPDSLRTPREPTENVGPRIDRDDLGNRIAMDWRELAKKLRSGDRTAILGDEEVASGITIERGYLVRGLGAIIEDSIADDANQEQTRIAIRLLGHLRTEAAVELLTQHMTYQPGVAQTRTAVPTPMETRYPCVAALIEIGSGAAADAVTARAEGTDDATVANCSATVVRGTFGNELATLYVKLRIEQQKDPIRRQRLTRLLEMVSESEKPADR